MAWILAAALVLAAVYAPEFRKLALIIGGAAGVFAFIHLFGDFDWLPPQPPPPIARSSPIRKLPGQPPKRIPNEQIEVGELRSNFGDDGISSIDVRIHNDSGADTLASADYTLLVDDCQGTELEPSHCATISDDTGTIVLEIPPKQARDVTINTREPYSGVAMLGHPRVRMIITAARAKRGTSSRASDDRIAEAAAARGGRLTVDRTSEGRIAEVIPDAQNGEGSR